MRFFFMWCLFFSPLYPPIYNNPIFLPHLNCKLFHTLPYFSNIFRKLLVFFSKFPLFFNNIMFIFLFFFNSIFFFQLYFNHENFFLLVWLNFFLFFCKNWKYKMIKKLWNDHVKICFFRILIFVVFFNFFKIN